MLRSTIKREAQEAHEKYVNEMISVIKQDPKSFWKYIQRQKKDQGGIPPLKRTNLTIAETNVDKAETLNK